MCFGWLAAAKVTNLIATLIHSLGVTTLITEGHAGLPKQGFLGGCHMTVRNLMFRPEPDTVWNIRQRSSFCWCITIPMSTAINFPSSACLAAVSWLSCCSPLINYSVMHCKCLVNAVVHAVSSSYIWGNWKRCDLTTSPTDYRCVGFPGALLFWRIVDFTLVWFDSKLEKKLKMAWYVKNPQIC